MTGCVVDAPTSDSSIQWQCGPKRRGKARLHRECDRISQRAGQGQVGGSGTGPESGGRTCNTSGFPGSSVAKDPPATAGDVGSIPGSGRSSGEGNGNLLQYSCLGNPKDRGAWQAVVHGVTKSQTQLRSSTAKQNTGAQGWDNLIYKWRSSMDQPPEATQGSYLQERIRAGFAFESDHSGSSDVWTAKWASGHPLSTRSVSLGKQVGAKGKLTLTLGVNVETTAAISAYIHFRDRHLLGIWEKNLLTTSLRGWTSLLVSGV